MRFVIILMIGILISSCGLKKDLIYKHQIKSDINTDARLVT
ncbi:MAG: hypothetical protein SFT68_03800 [Rickettsiaceae bacterium]|nr:hypothetical protein [Rickettsiaceae bacterium]